MMIDVFMHFQRLLISVNSHVHNTNCSFNGIITIISIISTNNKFLQIFRSIVWTEKWIVHSSKGVLFIFVVVHDS